jgi:hypothetical protein
MLTDSLHQMSAEEILKESGNRKDASMRHFTGMLYQETARGGMN